MIEPQKFYESLLENEFDFFAGVPDSLLKEFCACIRALAPRERNIIAANEGNAVALVSGYHIATGRYGVVYMQNSGLGNTVNPMLSLADEMVYGIPMLYIIGYRGEPGIHDEPQHVKQGILTLPLLDTLGIPYLMTDEGFEEQIRKCREIIVKENKSVALIVRKNLFAAYEDKTDRHNPYTMTREQALAVIVRTLSEDSFIVSTTGKTSREIFELREQFGMSHENDFLTVGSMGHASSLALGMSLFTEKNIYCIDGDGALLMHMGSIGVMVQNAKENLKYILINNGCHESVGRQPTVSYQLDMPGIFKGFGFEYVLEVTDSKELPDAMHMLEEKGKTAIIIYTNDISRADIGRPTSTPKENRSSFENKLRS